MLARYRALSRREPSNLSVVKLWKHLMLLAGLLGLVGVFTPLIETRTQTRFGPAALQLTAYELSFGFDKGHEILGRDLGPLVEKHLSANVKEARADARLVAEASRGAVLLFAPALALLGLGLVGIVKQRFGRVLGGIALVLAAASIAAHVGLGYGIEYGMREAAFERTTVQPLKATYLLVLAGGLGAVGAIGAIVRPQRPRTRKSIAKPPGYAPPR